MEHSARAQEGDTASNGGTVDGADRRVTSIFNSAVGAWAIAAAWEIGMLDELKTTKEVNAVEFAAAHGLDAASMVGLSRALAAVEVVEREGTVVRVSSNFDETYRTKSFFHWLVRGSAEIFRQMPHSLIKRNRVGAYYQRDSAAIAYACREINELCYDSTFWAAIARLGYDVGVVADLGCGSGGRVIDVLNRYPSARGIGVDIARPALENARLDAATAGLAKRTTFLEADVLDLQPRPEFADVDLVTCFMMGHDFWPKDRCVATLRRLRECFPAARRLLLGDATRVEGVADTDLPIFVLGFELGHDLMDITLPTIAEWEGVFEEGGWHLVRTNRIEMTVGEVIFELA
ncbi:class I SAM-dependent methyltransferase [Micromonospora sp. WMMA1363]|uniref:class I SAM-dependent methyltransferase n=1 Tax=Micromonospora sp. WMMA1363 TaxID=3053985 RepID=UPI00259CFD7C|nr:class I SAM-dependent methyltransferase [Micromonospora sp. WMMA1363]MDM4719668.1 class I SAM-dependent methyltransferase [Micromonospora sp. WMMA1363]